MLTSSREGWFEKPCDPIKNAEPWCQEFLLTQFKKGVEFNLENVEYRDTMHQHPYELIFPFDFEMSPRAFPTSTNCSQVRWIIS